ncbi:MAG: NirD/YgiW/YdeI family stress tolerance protein [Spirochaetales bacterium]|jgi:uncharacterized protein (TIGR00156 family)|nr:NirD/YgiW/YdeI family stress tolerance protein [Spirochaetales bacterium]
MKKNLLTGAVLILLFAFFAALPASAQEGFTGPSGREGGKTGVRSVTTAEAKTLRDDAKVVLQGKIIRSLGDEKYTFRDSAGEIIVEIDRDVWRGLSVSENDAVEIRGEIEKEGPRTEIDVKSIKKI